MAVDISSTIGGVKLSSALILGSFDSVVSADVLRRCFDICGDSLGAVVMKSTTINPRQGYPEPKVSRFGDGLLVASGNCNPGIDVMASEVRQFKALFSDPVVFGSIVSDPDHPQSDLAEEYCFLAVEYAKAGVDGLELNLSCPHLDPREKEQTIVPAQDETLVAQLISEVKSSLSRTGYDNCLVIPKLTGWNCNPTEVALSAEQAGADAVTISNLFPGTGYHTRTGEGHRIGDYLVSHGKGGYSGKAMHSAVLLMIETLRKHIGIPVIGTGGCATDLDSLVQTFMAGAVAVESVTPFYFRNLNRMEPLLKAKELMEQLKGFLDDHGLKNLDGLYALRKGMDSS
jgi:dihydroorotate dehydrogenase (NAD+) catalytic subunit